MLGGIDEAGRGPVFGPMVVAGVLAEDQDRFAQMGCRDSKLLAAPRREDLAAKIAEASAATEVVVCSADDIDRRRARETLNAIEVSLFGSIAKKLGATDLFLDAADVDEDRFGRLVLRALGKSGAGVRVSSKHRGDSLFPIVSAASIVAKVRRDAEVREMAAPLEAKLGMPLGSGYAHDVVTTKFLDAWFEAYGKFPAGTRASWDTARAIRARHATHVLDDFMAPAAVPKAAGARTRRV